MVAVVTAVPVLCRAVTKAQKQARINKTEYNVDKSASLRYNIYNIRGRFFEFITSEICR